jgi:SEC-C motif-containing protein
MRSRFSAFAVRDSAYLLRTWHRTTRPPRVTVDPAQCWDRLEILATTGGALFDSDGTVEFRAHYRHHGLPRTHHETSRFVREDGCWAYLDETGGHTDE